MNILGGIDPMTENNDDTKEHVRLIKYILGLLDKNPLWTIEQTKTMDNSDVRSFLSFLKMTEGFDLNENSWNSAVDEAFGFVEKRVKFRKQSELLSVSDSEYRLADDPNNPHNYWNQYRELLEKQVGFESAELISASCDNILKRLSIDSPESIKGLVHGSVQSGKTANMEGLISKAADAGFNVFIVFTGTLITLNQQTEGRFRTDLSGKYQYTIVSPSDIRKYPFIEPNARTICVSMKTTAKLRIVKKWLSNSSQRNNLKVLIIDDEADYASVNSGISEEKRTITNKLMMDLVNQKDLVPKYGCLNYVAFTATPYPNILNESGPDSLYPRNFIVSLPHADSYFGPQQIFGASYGPNEYPGLPIVNSSYDLDSEFRKLERGSTREPTEELKESIAWFISAVAALRLRGYKKPLTFMINTTHNVDPHTTVAKSIVDYIDSPEKRTELMEYCRIIYGRETAKFPKEVFVDNYPGYPKRLIEGISDYPKFEEIIPYINELLSDSCHHIKDEDGRVKYYRTLHICIENGCRVNLEDDEESVYISRIRYPREGDDCPDAPAFIVVGGNVLSRGLTLEGLITSFFLRPATTADTLMQMGRWFGFRPGYELYPRIWMSNRSYSDFCFLAQLDEEVREEIKHCNAVHSSPEKTAIRLLSIPKARDRGYLRSLCARNKMKASVASNISYIGKYEEFTRFRNIPDVLENNLQVTRDFIGTLNRYGPQIPSATDWNVVRWNNVPSEFITDYFLRKFRDGIEEDSEQSLSLRMLIQWMDNMKERGILRHWNILFAGTSARDPGDSFEISEGIRIGKISRSKHYKPADDDKIYIRTLRNRADLFKDVFPDEFTDRYLLTKIRSGDLDSELRDYERQTEWIENMPLMIIYCIDKDSKPKTVPGKETQKLPLNAVADVISFLVEVPNIDTQDGDMVQIKLDLDKIGEGDDFDL